MSLLPHLKYKGFIRPPFPFFSAPSSFVARSLFGLLISHGFLIGKNDGSHDDVRSRRLAAEESVDADDDDAPRLSLSERGGKSRENLLRIMTR